MLRLFDASPAWVLEADALIGFDLAFTRAVRLGGIDVGCEPDATLEARSAQIAETICAVPEGACLRFYSVGLAPNDAALSSFAHAFGRDPWARYVGDKKVQQFRHIVAPRQREIFCSFSTPPTLTWNGVRTNLLGRRAERMIAEAGAVHERKLAEARRLCDIVVPSLRACGTDVAPLECDALFALVWRLANPLSSLRREPPTFRPDWSLRQQLFSSGLRNHLDWFEREGALHRVVTLKLPPRTVVPTQALELQSLPFPHVLVVTLRRVSEGDAERRVDTTRRQGHELNRVLRKLRGAERHAEMPDHLVMEQQVDANDVLARLARGERLFDVAVQLWFAGDTHDELRSRTETVLARVRACGQAEGAIEELRGRLAFLSMLPTRVSSASVFIPCSRAAPLTSCHCSNVGRGLASQ